MGLGTGATAKAGLGRGVTARAASGMGVTVRGRVATAMAGLVTGTEAGVVMVGEQVQRTPAGSHPPTSATASGDSSGCAAVSHPLLDGAGRRQLLRKLLLLLLLLLGCMPLSSQTVCSSERGPLG